MPGEGENDKEEELTPQVEGEVAETEAAEAEESETLAEAESIKEEGDEEAEQISLPSDDDPFLLHMLRCEGLLKRLGSSLELQVNANERLQEAFKAVAEGDYEGALKALDEAGKGDEQDPLIPILTAVVFLKQGDAPQAASQCDAALALNAHDVNALICKAAADTAEHHFVEAFDRLSKALERAPNDEDILVSQGVCLIRLGRFEEAIRVLYRAQKNDRSNVRAWINKGIAYAYMHRVKDALNCFNEALVLDPDNADAHAAKEEMLQRLAH